MLDYEVQNPDDEEFDNLIALIHKVIIEISDINQKINHVLVYFYHLVYLI